MNLQLIFVHNDTKIFLNEEMNQLYNEVLQDLMLKFYYQNQEQQILVVEQYILVHLYSELKYEKQEKKFLSTYNELIIEYLYLLYQLNLLLYNQLNDYVHVLIMECLLSDLLKMLDRLNSQTI